MKKSAKNRTLYHVVNKSAWADIGAANTSSPIYWCYGHRSTSIQGADNKLGQFLGLDIKATADHRNFLQYFLESCPSLV
jgi:hypothetical protein